jgi:uncharacterized membrane protein
VFGAWLLRMDLHTAAIASAANVGGVAASSIVATHHRKSLVPAAILMALLGFAIGNYCGYITAMLCEPLAIPAVQTGANSPVAPGSAGGLN